MSTKQLVDEIENSEYILPKEILAKIPEDRLIREIQEIFDQYPEKIKQEGTFRKKYIELVNFVYLINLTKTSPNRKKMIFDTNLIKYLLSAPEAA